MYVDLRDSVRARHAYIKDHWSVDTDLPLVKDCEVFSLGSLVCAPDRDRRRVF